MLYEIHSISLLTAITIFKPKKAYDNMGIIIDLSHQPGKFQDEGTSVGDLLGISHAISKRGLHRYSIHATQSISLWNF